MLLPLSSLVFFRLYELWSLSSKPLQENSIVNVKERSEFKHKTNSLLPWNALSLRLLTNSTGSLRIPLILKATFTQGNGNSIKFSHFSAFEVSRKNILPFYFVIEDDE